MINKSVIRNCMKRTIKSVLVNCDLDFAGISYSDLDSLYASRISGFCILLDFHACAKRPDGGQ